MMKWEDITRELNKKLDPAHVKPAPAGKYGSYVEGWHVIAEANAIFGFGGWSYTITGLTKDSVEHSNGKWQAAYTCIVRVTVGDVVREDVGFGSGFAKQIGDAIEGATKEATTDALKRCLRTFGNRFGLALYDKTQANVGVDRDPEAIAKSLISNVSKANTLDKLNTVLGNAKFDEAWEWLQKTAPDVEKTVADAVNQKRDELTSIEEAA